MNRLEIGRVVAERMIVVVMSLGLFSCTVAADDGSGAKLRRPGEAASENLPAEGQAPPGAEPSRPEQPPTPAEPPSPNPGDEGSSGAPPPAEPEPEPQVPYRGVNLAGAEFGDALPGVVDKDYKFPTRAEVDYFMTKGMNTFRVGFKWERLQRSANGGFDSAYAGSLDDLVEYATSKGAFVILNPHNFARYYGKLVGSSDVPNSVFADFWRRLSSRYMDNVKVMFNLVNEPHSMRTEQWVSAANAAISAIRTAGAENVILAPGNAWTGAHSWESSSYGTPNAQAMLDIVDPKNNVLYEVHQYLDRDSSGSSSECVSETIGRERLVAFVNWLRKHERKGFLGEFAGANNARCNVAVRDMLEFIHASGDVLVGWTWWAAGPWWGEYKFTIEPKNGNDRPQLALLTPFLFLK